MPRFITWMEMGWEICMVGMIPISLIIVKELPFPNEQT